MRISHKPGFVRVMTTEDLVGILITASLINRTNTFSFRVIERNIFKRCLEIKKTEIFVPPYHPHNHIFIVDHDPKNTCRENLKKLNLKKLKIIQEIDYQHQTGSCPHICEHF